jgi:MYXO-CTERM domain-containing protein
MKRQLFAILMVLTLVATGAAFAQSTPPAQSNLQNETEPASGPDVDVDTGDRAEGAVDVDVNRTGDSDTSATGVDETGGMDQDTTGTAGDTDDLPGTASGLPTVALLGLLALAAAFTVRFFRS